MKIKLNYKTIGIIWCVLIGLTVYSFFTESINYVFRSGQILFGVTGVLGFLILISGISLFAYIAYVFIINTLGLLNNNEELMNNVAILRDAESGSEAKRQARKENFNFLIETWKPTFIYFAIAVLLIVSGAIMVNISTGLISLK
jgi:hypothetical protein